MENAKQGRGALSREALQGAFAQKAQLAVKYMLYAEHALKNGSLAEAEALNALAKQELKQADCILFRLSYFTNVDGGKPINIHNLKQLFADEESFIQVSPEFIKHVNSEGYTHTGTALTEIMAEDKLHLIILKELLQKYE